MSNVIRVWHVILISLCQGLVYSFDTPARQSFVVEMLEDRNDLSNAIALNSSVFNGARLIGPAIAGILIAKLGEGVCFLSDGISYVAVIASLLAMRVAPSPAAANGSHVLHDLKNGFEYAWGFSPIRSILLLLALVSFMGMPYSVLLPVFATNILHGNADTLGFLTAATGLGALAGAIYMAMRKTVLGLGRWIAVAGSIFGVGLCAFALSSYLWISLALMLLTGFGMMVQMASCNTVLQTIVEDDKRGRVMALYTVSFLGVAPFGSLAAGGVATLIGDRYTVLIGGICCVAGALCSHGSFRRSGASCVLSTSTKASSQASRRACGPRRNVRARPTRNRGVRPDPSGKPSSPPFAASVPVWNPRRYRPAHRSGDAGDAVGIALRVRRRQDRSTIVVRVRRKQYSASATASSPTQASPRIRIASAGGNSRTVGTCRSFAA